MLTLEQNWKKCTFFDNLRIITQERKGKQQKWPHFSSTFSALPVCNIHFWIWKYLKFIFRFIKWYILVCKITHHTHHKIAYYTFLESRHPEVTRLHLMDYLGGWAKFHAEPFCFLLLFWWHKIAFKSPFDLYFHPFIFQFFWFASPCSQDLCWYFGHVKKWLD